MLLPTLFNSREIKTYYTTPVPPRDGLKNIKHTVLNRGVGLICNYTHQNRLLPKNAPDVGDVFIVHCSFNHVLSHMSAIQINESNPGICSHLPTILSVWCRLRKRETRFDNRCGTSLGSRRVFGRQKVSVLPPSVAVHGQRCVLHHVVLHREKCNNTTTNYAQLSCVYTVYMVTTGAQFLDSVIDFVVLPSKRRRATQ